MAPLRKVPTLATVISGDRSQRSDYLWEGGGIASGRRFGGASGVLVYSLIWAYSGSENTWSCELMVAPQICTCALKSLLNCMIPYL